MKSIIKMTGLWAMILLMAACSTDFTNVNAPTDEQVLNSREGLIALSVGMQQLYSVSGLRWIAETPAVTTREIGITTTFQNMIELEDGGTELLNSNSNVSGLWATMLRINGMCDNLIAGAEKVELSQETRNSMEAYGKFYKALSIGALAQNYEQVITSPSLNNDAAFVPRMQGYATAITLLNEAASLVSGGVSDEFKAAVLGDAINLPMCIQAFLARYNLFAGNYDAAIAAANAVDASVVSEFKYDTQNPNPIWKRVLAGPPNFKPRDNFGIPDALGFDMADGRKAFYTVPADELNQNGLPVDDIAGFWNADTKSIPVYLPGEMQLIIAEAEARKGNLDAAVAALNKVRTKTDDPSGVNAGLMDYAGAVEAAAILNDIFANRRAELFLTGVSLEDSRRFGRPEPSGQSMMYSEERNRNFYPYPIRERSNNPNTPADPSI